jgi:hypothetical protein
LLDSWATASLNALNKSNDLAASTAGASAGFGASTVFTIGFYSAGFCSITFTTGFCSAYYVTDFGASIGLA